MAVEEEWEERERGIPDAIYPTSKTGSVQPSVHQGMWHQRTIISLAVVKEDIIFRV